MRHQLIKTFNVFDLNEPQIIFITDSEMKYILHPIFLVKLYQLSGEKYREYR